jgi:hypothetical protein
MIFHSIGCVQGGRRRGSQRTANETAVQSEPMTIREYYQRVQTWTKYVLAGVFITATFYIVFRYPKLPMWAYWVVGLGEAAVAMPILLVFMRRTYRCPGCEVNLMQLRVQKLGRRTGDRRMFWQIWDACPNCELSFDEPWTRAKR